VYEQQLKEMNKERKNEMRACVRCVIIYLFSITIINNNHNHIIIIKYIKTVCWVKRTRDSIT
jgi:hypothetical protein